MTSTRGWGLGKGRGEGGGSKMWTDARMMQTGVVGGVRIGNFKFFNVSPLLLLLYPVCHFTNINIHNYFYFCVFSLVMSWRNDAQLSTDRLSAEICRHLSHAFCRRVQPRQRIQHLIRRTQQSDAERASHRVSSALD